jgi:hypothetical protein
MFADFDTVYEYTSEDDTATHYVGRIEARDGRKKQFFPVTFGVSKGRRGWFRKAPDIPRPLYGLNRLPTMPDAVVIVCEGEKAADAAQAIFFDHACLSWFGGAGQVDNADFGPLVGRKVIIWPDNDTAGRKVADRIAKRLPQAYILRVDDLGDGDDAADVAPDDPKTWLADRLLPAAMRLDGEWWLTRQLQKPEPLLGEVITDTTRSLLGGASGIGKTHLAMAMAGGMATGLGFAHWRAPHRVRVLYIDGEMPRDLVQERLADLKRRLGGASLTNLVVLCREDFPDMEPLNSEAGQQFLLEMVEQHHIRAVFFDNRMALLSGSMREEEPWTDTLPLIRELTRRRVAQIWIDHAGHDAARIYGTKTKEWHLDAVAILTKVERPGSEIAFMLDFTKARRRRPDNRGDFEAVTLVLENDQWRVEGAQRVQIGARLSPMARQFHRALLDALAVSARSGQTTRLAWYAECTRTGLAETVCERDTSAVKRSKSASFRKYMSQLKAAGLVGINGETVYDLRKDLG